MSDDSDDSNDINDVSANEEQEIDKREQIENFLKTLKIVVNPADEWDDDNGMAFHFDYVLLHDGKKVMDGKWHCGGGWSMDKIKWNDILGSIFLDASCYCRSSAYANGDETDALAEFLEEFGYLDDAKSVKKGIKAFKGCREEYQYIAPLVLNNCAWLDGRGDGYPEEYLSDIETYFDEGDVPENLVELDWDSYVEDYK